jgi:hypothetical protein
MPRRNNRERPWRRLRIALLRLPEVETEANKPKESHVEPNPPSSRPSARHRTA